MSKKKRNRAAEESVPQVSAERRIQRRNFTPWMKHVAVAAALFVLILLAYSNSFHCGFTLDNKPLILQDPRLLGATSENVSLIFSHPAWWGAPETGLYRPFTTLTYLLNYSVFGNTDQPEGYHYFNLLIHFANVLLCYAIALLVLKRFWPAVFVAAIWAVHPVLTESVTNIVGRADLLAGFGMLCGLWMYLKSREAWGVRRIAWLLGLIAAATVGIFAKESGIAIAGLIVLCEIAWWKGPAQLRSAAYGLLAAALPIIAFLMQRWSVLRHSKVTMFSFTANPLLGAGFFTARLTAVKILARYLWILIWPAKLSWNYYFSEIPLARGALQDWLAWIVILAVVLGASFAYWRNRTVFFFAAFAFIALIPVSNLILLIGSSMADRFLYLPAIGFAACVVIGLCALGERFGSRKFAPIVACLLVLALGIRTYSRNSDWLDNSTLTESGVRVTPQSFASHFALATNLYMTDRTHSNLDRVIAEGEKSLAILDPLPDSRNFEDAYANAGTYYQLKGALLQRDVANGVTAAAPASVKAYQRALQILLRGAAIGRSYDQQVHDKEIARGKKDSEIPHSGSKSLYPEIALTYLGLGDVSKAHEAILNALIVDPEQSKTFGTLAQILVLEKKNDEAAVAVVEAYMVSGSKEILAPLAQLYRTGLDPQGCAISRDANGLSLNTFCEPVHNHICRAKADLIRVYTLANRGDLIDDLKTRTASDSSCAVAPQK
jgi:tetratricopeptide (TPR) repeat protein